MLQVMLLSVVLGQTPESPQPPKQMSIMDKFKIPLSAYPDCFGERPRIKNAPPGFYEPFGGALRNPMMRRPSFSFALTPLQQCLQ